MGVRNASGGLVFCAARNHLAARGNRSPRKTVNHLGDDPVPSRAMLGRRLPRLMASYSTLGHAAAAAVVLSLTIACSSKQAAGAGSWKHYSVKGSFGGVIGHGVEIGGQLTAGHGVRPGFFNADCVDNQTVVRVEARNFDFGTSPVRVRWAAGDAPEQADIWQVCDDGSCIGLWQGQGIPFLKSLMGATQLNLTIESRYAKPITASFPIEGSLEALGSVGRHCGWL